MVRKPPAHSGVVRDTSLDLEDLLVLEDLLEEEMATHSSILTWEIPWTEEPGKLQSMESQKSRT